MDGDNTIWSDGLCELNLTAEKAEEYLYTHANRMFVTVGIPIVLILGLIGNFGFLIVLYRVKHMRTITNLYLANLSGADSCLLIMSAIQYFWTYSHSPLDVNFVFASSFGCALPNSMVYLCYFASVWLVTLVATERYMAICHPLRQHMITGRGHSFRLLGIAWGMSLLMTGFAAPYGNPEIVCIDWPQEGPYAQFPSRVPVCRGTCDWCDKALYLIDPAQFIFAFFINTLMYGRIIVILSRRSFINHSESDSTSRSTSASARLMAENRDQVARMLIVNTCMFFVCLMPYCITNLNSLFREIQGTQGFLNLRQKQILSWISKLTTLLNSAANPYLYSVTNKRYRQAFLQAFNCFKQNKNDKKPPTIVYTRASTLDESKV